MEIYRLSAVSMSTLLLLVLRSCCSDLTFVSQTSCLLGEQAAEHRMCNSHQPALSFLLALLEA